MIKTFPRGLGIIDINVLTDEAWTKYFYQASSAAFLNIPTHIAICISLMILSSNMNLSNLVYRTLCNIACDTSHQLLPLLTQRKPIQSANSNENLHLWYQTKFHVLSNDRARSEAWQSISKKLEHPQLGRLCAVHFNGNLWREFHCNFKTFHFKN